MKQLVCEGKTLRGSAVETDDGSHCFVAQVTVYARAHGVAVPEDLRHPRILRASRLLAAGFRAPVNQDHHGREAWRVYGNSVFDLGIICQPVRFWNPGRRRTHHKQTMPEVQPVIKQPSIVQQGYARSEPFSLRTARN